MNFRLRMGLLVTALLYLPLVSTAQSPASKNMVSVRELSIPAKAQHAFDKGATQLAKNDALGSLLQFERAIAEYKGYYEAYYEMGVADLKLWRIPDAETSFRKSIDLSGEQFAPALLALGAVLGYQQKFAEAEEVIGKGLNMDPSSWSGHYYLGWAIFGLNRVEEAEKEVREALRLKADSTEALQLLADIHSRQKDYPALVNDLDAYLKLDPDSPTAIKARALRKTAQRLIDESQNTTALALQ
jgi:tetratricopeptide (TPR) repeat protein